MACLNLYFQRFSSQLIDPLALSLNKRKEQFTCRAIQSIAEKQK